jgi:gluconokinase
MNSSSNERPSAPAVIIVMGYQDSGESTVASLLALRLHWEFEEGDWFHPSVNIDKMHNRTPLTDDDRKPWLAAIVEWIDQTRRRGDHAVLACSALKRRYRAVLIGDVPMSASSISRARKRLSRAASPPGTSISCQRVLLSQFQALEEPGADERPLTSLSSPGPARSSRGSCRR